MPKTTTSETTVELLRQRAAAVRDFAARFDRMADQMVTLQANMLKTTSGESWTRAVKSLVAYAAAIQRSIDAKLLDSQPPERQNANHTARAEIEPLIVAEHRKRYTKG